METEKLYKILQDSTKVYRKGEVVETRRVGNVDVVEMFGWRRSS